MESNCFEGIEEGELGEKHGPHDWKPRPFKNANFLCLPLELRRKENLFQIQAQLGKHRVGLRESF